MLFAHKPLILAPMAGITDPVFRQICKSQGADILVSEMVSADGLVYDSRKTAALTAFEQQERPLGIQIFGAKPDNMAYAAQWIATHAQPDFIDINSGCPVPKVIRKNGGAALLRDLELFGRIVEAVCRAVSIPVTVKIRSGWDKENLVDVEAAHIAQQAGAGAVIVHPRTRSMGFGGSAMWERIGLVKQALTIPVIGNGDIVTPGDAARMFAQTGCDAVMIGRGALGNPWIFGQCRSVIEERRPAPVSQAEKYRVMRLHLHQYSQVHGERSAAKEMKKHFAWYIKNMPAAGGLRRALFAAQTTAQLNAIIDDYFHLHTEH